MNVPILSFFCHLPLLINYNFFFLNDLPHTAQLLNLQLLFLQLTIKSLLLFLSNTIWRLNHFAVASSNRSIYSQSVLRCVDTQISETYLVTSRKCQWLLPYSHTPHCLHVLLAPVSDLIRQRAREVISTGIGRNHNFVKSTTIMRSLNNNIRVGWIFLFPIFLFNSVHMVFLIFHNIIAGKGLFSSFWLSVVVLLL